MAKGAPSRVVMRTGRRATMKIWRKAMGLLRTETRATRNREPLSRPSVEAAAAVAAAMAVAVRSQPSSRRYSASVLKAAAGSLPTQQARTGAAVGSLPTARTEAASPSSAPHAGKEGSLPSPHPTPSREVAGVAATPGLHLEPLSVVETTPPSLRQFGMPAATKAPTRVLKRVRRKGLSS